MKIFIEDSREGKKESPEKDYDKMIYLSEQFPVILQKECSHNECLSFLDFLLTEISVEETQEIYYFGKDARVWAYLLLFSYMSPTFLLYNREEEIEESQLLCLEARNEGMKATDMKSEFSEEDYQGLPPYIQNLYYYDEKREKACLSKVGELYVKNIRNL